jgi:hypothetical protein
MQLCSKGQYDPIDMCAFSIHANSYSMQILYGKIASTFDLNRSRNVSLKLQFKMDLISSQLINFNTSTSNEIT